MTRAGNYGHLKHFNAVKRVEIEFEMPILDIINGLREDGYTWETVAGAMGITVLTLFRWRKKFGMEITKKNNVHNKPDNVENIW